MAVLRKNFSHFKNDNGPLIEPERLFRLRGIVLFFVPLPPLLRPVLGTADHIPLQPVERNLSLSGAAEPGTGDWFAEMVQLVRDQEGQIINLF
jgi:hypothetical protein